MFLSRVEIPWEAARNPYNLHRQLWHLFPDEDRESRSSDDEIRQGFLFRIEDNATGRPARLLVQSRRAPIRADGLLLGWHARDQPMPQCGSALGLRAHGQSSQNHHRCPARRQAGKAIRKMSRAAHQGRRPAPVAVTQTRRSGRNRGCQCAAPCPTVFSQG